MRVITGRVICDQRLFFSSHWRPEHVVAGVPGYLRIMVFALYPDNVDRGCGLGVIYCMNHPTPIISINIYEGP